MTPNTLKEIRKHNFRLIGFGKIKNGTLITKGQKYNLTGATAESIQRTTHSTILITLGDGTKLTTPAQHPTMAEHNHLFAQSINRLGHRLKEQKNSEERMTDKKDTEEYEDMRPALKTTTHSEHRTHYGYVTNRMASCGISPNMETIPVTKPVFDLMEDTPSVTIDSVANTMRMD